MPGRLEVILAAGFASFDRNAKVRKERKRHRKNLA